MLRAPSAHACMLVRGQGTPRMRSVVQTAACCAVGPLVAASCRAATFSTEKIRCMGLHIRSSPPVARSSLVIRTTIYTCCSAVPRRHQAECGSKARHGSCRLLRMMRPAAHKGPRPGAPQPISNGPWVREHSHFCELAAAARACPGANLGGGAVA